MASLWILTVFYSQTCSVKDELQLPHAQLYVHPRRTMREKRVVEKKSAAIHKTEMKKMRRNSITKSKNLKPLATSFSIHAEAAVLARCKKMLALNKIGGEDTSRGRTFNYNKLRLFVIRVGADGQLMNSKPCTHCTNMMIQLGIRRVSYSTDDGTICTDKLAQLQTSMSTGHKRISQDAASSSSSSSP